MANHGIFHDFLLTQRAKFGGNPARFLLRCATFTQLCCAIFRAAAVLFNFRRSIYVFMCVHVQQEAQYINVSASSTTRHVAPTHEALDIGAVEEENLA